MFAFMMDNCVRCGGRFNFNPTAVPAVMVDGAKRPLCRKCAEWIEKERAKMGMAVRPIREDAYSCCREEDLG